MNKICGLILGGLLLLQGSFSAYAAITPIEATIYGAPNVTNRQSTEQSSSYSQSNTSTVPQKTAEEIEEEKEICKTLPLCRYGFDCYNDENCVDSKKSDCCNGEGVKSTFNACKYDIQLPETSLKEYNVNMDILNIRCCYLRGETTYFCEDDPRQCSYKGVNAQYRTKMENFLTYNEKAPENCSSIGIADTYSTNCTSTGGQKLLVCAGTFANHPVCSSSYETYPSKALGIETQYFLCNTQIKYKEKYLFGYQQFDKSQICEFIIEEKASASGTPEKWVEEVQSSSDSWESVSCLNGQTGQMSVIHHVCKGYVTKQICDEYDVTPEEACKYNDNKSFGIYDLYKCSCPEGWKTEAVCKAEGGTVSGKVCTLDGETRYEKCNTEKPYCEDIITYGNIQGLSSKPRTHWFSYAGSATPIKQDCIKNNTTATVYGYCGDNEKTGWKVKDSFKSSLCANGAASDAPTCSYRDGSKEITVTTACACGEEYVSKEQLCGKGVNEDGTNANHYDACLINGVFDESDICKTNPNDDNTTLYKKVECPNKFLSLDEWWKRNWYYINFDEFLGNVLGLSDATLSDRSEWKAFYTPVDETSASCSYGAERKVVIDEKTKKEEVTTVSLEPKYLSYDLSCNKVSEAISSELNYVPEADKFNLSKITGCWNGEQKWFSSCSPEFWEPLETYKPSGKEDVCPFGNRKYYKYGGDCPTKFTGSEALISESMSDNDIKAKYGNVEISYCNNQNVKTKLIYCDPKLYTQVCAYPYEYTYTPENDFCRRNDNGGQITETSTIYYSAKGEKVQCYYSPSTCHAEVNRKSAEGYEVNVVDIEGDCTKKYGTAVKVEECQDRNGETKYSCYWPKNKFVFNTSNCSIGKDLSRPYILINGVKHWDRCDCAPSYKYHFDNCELDNLYGNVCVQDVVTKEFIDARPNDPTLQLGAVSVEFYTGCKTAKQEQTDTCKNPSGIWAVCKYCCPRGMRANGKVSKDSCGKTIYGCK